MRMLEALTPEALKAPSYSRKMLHQHVDAI